MLKKLFKGLLYAVCLIVPIQFWYMHDQIKEMQDRLHKVEKTQYEWNRFHEGRFRELIEVLRMHGQEMLGDGLIYYNYNRYEYDEPTEIK